jgi:hypothetical protein
MSLLKEKKIKIYVGPVRPSDALLGRLENDNATIKGFAEPCNSIGGMQIIPNRSIVWGIRLDKEGKRPKDKIQPNDKGYSGKVEFVMWGTAEGMPITTRYKSGSPSIDYDYQVLQMGMPRFENDIEDNYIQLPFGENTIFDSEEARQLFLTTTHECVDSICKNPDITNGNIRIVKIYESPKEEVKLLDKEFEAQKIVRAATTFDHLMVLKTIVSDKHVVKYDESDETTLFENILLYAKKNAPEFLGSIQAYNGRVSDVIEKFRSYKAYDWTTNGRLMGGRDKKEILVDGIDAKGEDMVQYLFDSRMEPAVFDAINRMIVMAQNFK